jgi:hypothetical protein
MSSIEVDYYEESSGSDAPDALSEKRSSTSPQDIGSMVDLGRIAPVNYVKLYDCVTIQGDEVFPSFDIDKIKGLISSSKFELEDSDVTEVLCVIIKRVRAFIKGNRYTPIHVFENILRGARIDIRDVIYDVQHRTDKGCPICEEFLQMPEGSWLETTQSQNNKRSPLSLTTVKTVWSPIHDSFLFTEDITVLVQSHVLYQHPRMSRGHMHFRIIERNSYCFENEVVSESDLYALEMLRRTSNSLMMYKELDVEDEFFQPFDLFYKSLTRVGKGALILRALLFSGSSQFRWLDEIKVKDSVKYVQTDVIRHVCATYAWHEGGLLDKTMLQGKIPTRNTLYMDDKRFAVL